VKLSRVNTLLLITIILVNGITVVLPFTPVLLFAAEGRGGQKQQRLEQAVRAEPSVNTPNRLIMPAALSDQTVFEGPNALTLKQGVWHRPQTSTPDKGGNTVFAAHRFTYTNPRGAFYHLDKLQVGDPVGVVWNGKMYKYTVSEIKTVGPGAAYIEDPTAEPRLTLYTCTPLTLPKDRLVVIATPQPQETTHE